MRHWIFGSLGLAAAVFFVAGDARAATFPATGWIAVQKSGANMSDASDVPGQAYNDVVGDASNAAVLLNADATFLFFRLRIAGDPLNNGNFRNAWGCAIDTNGVSNNYEFLAMLDGSANTDFVVWRANGTTASPDLPTENADTTPYQAAITGNGQSNQIGVSGFYYVDFAIPWATVNASFTSGTSIRFACGSSNNGTNVGLDPVAGATANASATLTNMWSTPYVCTQADGCRIDTDGDSVPDTVEVGFGTDPTKKDTDGDGINDNVELAASPASPFTFSKVDTDLDFVIDAKDLDSDNDCLPDLQEPATYRDPAQPNLVTSSNCANPTPVCAGATGCVACANDQGGAAPACYTASFPACLAGSCRICRPGLTTNCTTSTAPACESTTGACAACNGDNGSAATAVCPSPASPACQTLGVLTGRCTVCSATNLSLCTTATAPTCDPANGTCAACDGDHAGGTTKGCPTTGNPYCRLPGDGGVANAGSCGKCTSNADCGAGHAGPTCDLVTGACVDKDSDGDGINDSVELLLGTDRDKADSDGDGLNDLVETTLYVGDGPHKIDSDSDGIIDALDPDSDNDGIPDAIEGTADPDKDIIPAFRDADDDNDQIPTATEIALAAKSNLTDDVDSDGRKNYLDTDADGDGKGDVFEGTGDDDDDGIPNFLDADDKTPKPFDAGPPITPGPTSPNDTDAGSSSSSTGGPAAAPDDGVVEGNGFACSTHAPGGSSGLVIFLLGVVALAAARRRR